MTNNIIDILSTLPLEIYEELFQHLSLRECWQLAGVCRLLRSVILHWQPFWRCLSANDHRSIVPDMLPYTDFIESGSVKQIFINTSDEHQLPKVLDFLASQKYHAISQVDLSVQDFTEAQLATLVSICSSTLKKITISGLAANANNINPETLLRYCPNLAGLDFKGCWALGGRSNNSMKNFKHVALTDLSLEFYNVVDLDIFDPIVFLASVPRLHRLSMKIDLLHQAREMLPTILREHCSELTTLVIHQHNDWHQDHRPYRHQQQRRERNGANNITSTTRLPGNHTSDNVMSALPSQREQQGQQRGLQSIVLHEDDYPAVARGIFIPLVEHYHEQLVSLDLEGTGTVNNEVLTHLASLTLSSLRYLKLKQAWTWTGPTVRPSVLRLLFRQTTTPSLAYVELHQMDGMDDTVLTSSIAAIPNLQELVLVHCCYTTTEEGMFGFIKRCRSSNNNGPSGGSSLRSLTIKDTIGETITPRVLLFMADQLENLQELTLKVLEYNSVGLSAVEHFLVVRHNTKKGLLKKLDVSFDYKWYSKYPSDFRIDRLLQSIDAGAQKWRYAVVIPNYDNNNNNNIVVLQRREERAQQQRQHRRRRDPHQFYQYQSRSLENDIPYYEISHVEYRKSKNSVANNFGFIVTPSLKSL